RSHCAIPPYSLSLPLHCIHLSSSLPPRRSPSTLFPYTTLFRSLLPSAYGTRYYREKCGQLFPIKQTVQIFWLVKRSLVSWYVERSEEHTSELQSRFELVCRLLREKKKDVLRTQSTGECTLESKV